MKAITYTTTGPSSVLTLVDGDEIAPATGEVRVRVVVSGVNPTDWKSRSGGGSVPPEEFSTPKVPNQDGAGVVEAVGDGVDGFSVGDRVWLWDVAWQSARGTAQQSVTLPATQVVHLPDGESFDTGASLGIPALTAHLALTSHERHTGTIAAGSLDGVIVLVTGGAGAVGHAAIQLASWAGATVITTVSSEEKGALAKRAGAHHVIDYRTGDVVAEVKAIAPGGVDIVVDVNLIANIADDLQVIAPNGTIASYAFDGDSDSVAISIGAAMGRNVRFQFILTYTAAPNRKAEAIAGVSAALAAGALRVGEEHGLPLIRFALDATADAHDAVESGVTGKVLIDVG